jgi:hypothetical protein
LRLHHPLLVRVQGCTAPEITDLGDPLLPNQDVVWLQVPVNHLLLMSIGQPPSDVLAYLDLFAVVEGASLEVVGETASLAVLDDHVVLALVDEVAVVEPGDVGVVQQSQVVDFPDDLFDLLDCLLVEVFECNFIFVRIGDFIDGSIAALPQQLAMVDIVELAKLFASDAAVAAFVLLHFLCEQEHENRFFQVFIILNCLASKKFEGFLRPYPGDQCEDHPYVC